MPLSVFILIKTPGEGMQYSALWAQILSRRTCASIMYMCARWVYELSNGGRCFIGSNHWSSEVDFIISWCLEDGRCFGVVSGASGVLRKGSQNFRDVLTKYLYFKKYKPKSKKNLNKTYTHIKMKVQKLRYKMNKLNLKRSIVVRTLHAYTSTF